MSGYRDSLITHTETHRHTGTHRRYCRVSAVTAVLLCECTFTGSFIVEVDRFAAYTHNPSSSVVPHASAGAVCCRGDWVLGGCRGDKARGDVARGDRDLTATGANAVPLRRTGLRNAAPALSTSVAAHDRKSSSPAFAPMASEKCGNVAGDDAAPGAAHWNTAAVASWYLSNNPTVSTESTGVGIGGSLQLTPSAAGRAVPPLPALPSVGRRDKLSSNPDSSDSCAGTPGAAVIGGVVDFGARAASCSRRKASLAAAAAAASAAAVALDTAPAPAPAPADGAAAAAATAAAAGAVPELELRRPAWPTESSARGLLARPVPGSSGGSDGEGDDAGAGGAVASRPGSDKRGDECAFTAFNPGNDSGTSNSANGVPFPTRRSAAAVSSSTEFPSLKMLSSSSTS